MEVKVMSPPQASEAPDSPTSESKNKQDSRSTRIVQYLTRTVSGNGFKDRNTLHLHKETRPHDVSEGEESDEDTRRHVPISPSSSDAVRPSLIRKLSHILVKTEPPLVEQEKGPEADGVIGWGMRKSVVEASKGVAADLKGSFGRLLEMKGMLIEKLSSMPTVSADTLEHARHSMESIISEVTHSAYGKTREAYGKTREAMVRIRVKLEEIIPSLSAHETEKIVDDVEREVLNQSEAASAGSMQPENTNDRPRDGKLDVSASTVSSTPISRQPASGLIANMDRLKAWALLRSRL